MTKRISKYTLLFSIPIAIIIFIVESLISKRVNFLFTLSFIIGLVVGFINFYLTDLTLKRFEDNLVSKPKLYFTSINLSKFLLYGVVMFLVAYFFGEMTLFTCALGMLMNKIVIHYLYLVKDPRDDKIRRVDSLDISKDVKDKLKSNGFTKTKDITEVNREKLLTFLTEEEVEQVIQSLKKYELYIKGELEAIIDDDEDDDI